MEINNIDISKILEKIENTTAFINSNEVPDIGLYMDQVLTLLGDKLTFLESEDGKKNLTKTMINNYSKNNMLPSPQKKKYTKDHIILLAFIYYYKTLLSIGEIKTFMTPLKDKYFGGENDIDLPGIYETACNFAKENFAVTKSDIENKVNKAKETFCDLKEETRDELQMYSLISALSYDIFVKKTLVEELIKQMEEDKKN